MRQIHQPSSERAFPVLLSLSTWLTPPFTANQPSRHIPRQAFPRRCGQCPRQTLRRRDSYLSCSPSQSGSGPDGGCRGRRSRRSRQRPGRSGPGSSPGAGRSGAFAAVGYQVHRQRLTHDSTGVGCELHACVERDKCSMALRRQMARHRERGRVDADMGHKASAYEPTSVSTFC